MKDVGPSSLLSVEQEIRTSRDRKTNRYWAPEVFLFDTTVLWGQYKYPFLQMRIWGLRGGNSKFLQLISGRHKVQPFWPQFTGCPLNHVPHYVEEIWKPHFAFWANILPSLITCPQVLLRLFEFWLKRLLVKGRTPDLDLTLIERVSLKSHFINSSPDFLTYKVSNNCKSLLGLWWWLHKVMHWKECIQKNRKYNRR